MKNKKLLVITAVICLVLLITSVPLFGGCSSDNSATTSDSKEGKTLKVGIMTPTTGAAASKGGPLRDGNMDCIKYINEELGGVNGYLIDAENLDSQYKSDQAVIDINKFMDDGCIFFTTSSSTEMNYVQEIANRAGFPGLVAYSSPTNYHPPQHIYGQMPDYGDDWTAFTEYYLNNIWTGTGKPKMALMLLNNPTGAGALNAAKAMADELGVEILWDGSYGKGFEHTATTTSETDALTRIKAMNPDVIYISSIPEAASVIIKNARDLDMLPGVTFGLCHAAMTKKVVDLAGASAAEGVYGVFPTVEWTDNSPAIAKMKEYATMYHPDDVNNGDYMAAWAQSLIIAEILQKALDAVGYDVLSKGDAEAWEAVEQYGFQTLEGYDVGGLQSPVSYVSGDNRLGKSLRIVQVQSGSIVAVTGWVEAPLIKYEDYSWFGQ
ncbi:MAG: ABC transporter substrate-binding protein [Dehalococcoidales bacterium]|jgi:branched-chain amino acid transport system substrate-binding protein